MKTRFDLKALARAQSLRAEGKTFSKMQEILGISRSAIAKAINGSQRAYRKVPYGDIFDHRNEYLCLLSPEARASLDQHYNNTRK